MNQEVQNLIKEIEEVFPSRPLGDDYSLQEAILPHDWADSESKKEAYKQARSQDIIDDWKRVPDKDLHDAFIGISIFNNLKNENGWQYYLPAAMRYALKNWSECREYIIIHLLNYKPEEMKRLYLFTDEQLKCMARFLIYMHKVDADTESESSWWNRKEQKEAMINWEKLLK